LLNGLREEDVEDRLHLTVVFEQIIVADLGHFVDARLFWHILWRRRFRKEFISLNLDIALFGLFAALLSQEVSQVDLNAGWGSWSQVVWLCLGFRLLEFKQLLFNHLNLLFLTLHLDALLFLLRRGQVLVQARQIVCVSSEDTLVIHDVEGLTVIVLVIVVRVRVVR